MNKINDELRSLYHLVLLNDWQPCVKKVINGVYYVYFWRGEDAGYDSVPVVLKPKDVSFKTCENCNWKPDDEYNDYMENKKC